LISDGFTVEELGTALVSVKPGKTTGLDGVYPEFIKNSGRKTMDNGGVLNDGTIQHF
jgi:hypothetical protein